MVRKIDALYDVAETLGHTGDRGTKTVDAINDINAALGYDGTRKRKVADALVDLNTVVDGGGGGGASIGDLVPVPIALMETPTIGGSIEQANPMLPPYVAVGGKRVFDGQLQYTQKIASGLEAGIDNAAGYTLSGYVLTIAAGTSTITAIEPWPLESKTIDGRPCVTWVMPALASSDTEFQLLALVPVQDDEPIST